MTQMLDRPKTGVEFDSAIETLERPMEVEKEEIRQLPPPEKPRRLFRWLGWLLGLAVVAVLSWIVIAEITSDEPVASPTYEVTQPGAIIADPKARTPVMTLAQRAELIRAGQPGEVSLTDMVTFGAPVPIGNLETTTVYPGIYWAPRVPAELGTALMDEATVSPGIYWPATVQPDWSTDTYWRVGTNPEPAVIEDATVYPGVYWSPRVVIQPDTTYPEEPTLTPGIYWPPVIEPDWSLDTYELISTYQPPVLRALPGVYWSPRVVMHEDTVYPTDVNLSTGMYWPALNLPDWSLETFAADVAYNWQDFLPDWPPGVFEYETTAFGGSGNIMR